MPAPQAVLTLVENFRRNLDAYRSGKYNETQVRRDFIDPLFKALGWDMDNSAGYAEAYRDVIHEDAIKIGNSVKAPDYSFRIGGQRKFFLEAKKPSVNVKEDVEPAFQLRRYAWSAKLPLSIVTDFEEFAVYDCRQKPVKNDKASKARLFYCTFRDYAEKWDEIAAIFSKEAVLKGSFDKYASTSKGKRGTSEVDGAFLEEIEGWRDLLARNIALRNSALVGAPPGRDSRAGHAPAESESRPGGAPTENHGGLSQRELNFAVQQTIDRIIFLRICEDRGIEPYGRLMALQNGANVYARLREMFRDADDRYNSGLFHFKREKGRAEAPDELTLNLEIDDKPLKEIFRNLYYPDCPYEFSVLGADILGQVYEQFLGKVIRLTAGNRAVVEDKPEVKKAGGVFYTPAYIVQYIVEHTVGKLLEGKTPKQVKGISILDPACGSGSFLIGAYQHLLDWHLERYVEEGAEKHSKGKEARLRHSAGGEWRLTTAEKKRILLEHIYGVDIDAQAVEVSKLSLLLKMLEGESDETLNSQMKLFHERVLPDLERNIQCGNSLIGPDFYDGQLDLDDEAAQRINVFDWQAAFPHIFPSPSGRGARGEGGFDAVIGNPPYGAYLFETEKDYLRQKYLCQSYQLDSYQLFLEQSLKRLIRSNGRYGMIIPNPWLTNLLQTEIRKYLFGSVGIDEIVHFKFPVFAKAVVDTQILLIQKASPSKRSVQVKVVSTPDDLFSDSPSTGMRLISHNQDKWMVLNGGVVNIFTSPDEEELARKISSRSVLLETLCSINVGIKPYQVGKGKPAQTKETVASRPYDATTRLDESFRPYLRGSDIQKYLIHPIESRYLKYGPWLAEPRPAANFDAAQKIVMRQTGDSLVAALDTQKYLCLNNMHVLVNNSGEVSDLFLLGLINSKLLNWYYQTLNPEAGEALAEVKKTNVARLPIIALKNHQNSPRVVVLVEKMLALHRQLAAAKTPQDATLLQRQIDATDKQIDQLVYQLYGLTDEEIALVEGST